MVMLRVKSTPLTSCTPIERPLRMWDPRWVGAGVASGYHDRDWRGQNLQPSSPSPTSGGAVPTSGSSSGARPSERGPTSRPYRSPSTSGDDRPSVRGRRRGRKVSETGRRLLPVVTTAPGAGTRAGSLSHVTSGGSQRPRTVGRSSLTGARPSPCQTSPRRPTERRPVSRRHLPPVVGSRAESGGRSCAGEDP